MEGIYRGYQTVSCFVMKELDGIPNEGEHFEFHGQRFEIVDMDGHRVDKVLVTPQPQGLLESDLDVGVAEPGEQSGVGEAAESGAEQGSRKT
jgi:hypothetical protein